jgi:signal transduction histidine kinase
VKRVYLLLSLMVLGAFPGRAQSQAEAEAFVKKAITFAKANGEYKLIKAVNAQEPQFRQGELYIWIVDGEGVMLANGANPKLIGKDMAEAKDSSNVRFAQQAAQLGESQGSGWFEYKFMNPVTQQVQPKLCYIEKYNSVVVACGIYKK